MQRRVVLEVNNFVCFLDCYFCFVDIFDLCTMWMLYSSTLPLLTAKNVLKLELPVKLFAVKEDHSFHIVHYVTYNLSLHLGSHTTIFVLLVLLKSFTLYQELDRKFYLRPESVLFLVLPTLRTEFLKIEKKKKKRFFFRFYFCSSLRLISVQY